MLEDFSLFIKDDNRNFINVDSVIKKFDIPKRLINEIKRKNYCSEKELLTSIENLLGEYESLYLLPGHYLMLYPQIKEVKSTKKRSCNLTGTIINKGEIYYEYHPFIEDLSNSNVYVTGKNIICARGMEHLLPTNIHEYEDWYIKLECNYNDENSLIDFYTFCCEAGSGALELKKLKRR